MESLELQGTYDTLVIGAGQAGLANGYHLQKTPLKFLIVEASEQSAGSWPSYYDSLKLFSPARYSSLPGRPFPGDPSSYPVRDEVIEYLTSYAHHFQLPVVTGERVVKLEQDADRFSVSTQTGKLYRAHSVIVATGSFHYPHLPQLPGQTTYQGQILHSAHYRNPQAFKDQRVLVVGSRNSAVQVAYELAQVAHTTLTSLTPVKYKPQLVLGKDVHFWMRVSGLDTFPFGYWNKTIEARGVLDYNQTYRKALAEGKPEWRPLFNEFSSNGVIWTDGQEEAVDSVIFATGYQPSPDFLQNSAALDAQGRPIQKLGISLSVPGLYYVGLAGQRSFSSATLRGVGPDAAYIVRQIQNFLKDQARIGQVALSV